MKPLYWIVMLALLSGTACTRPASEQKSTTPNNSAADSSIEADFRVLDGNHDGSIARDEIEKVGSELLLANFDRFDADRNGKLSLPEITAYVMAQREEVERRRKEVYNQLDTNKDGGLSLEEAEKGDKILTTNFDYIDSNKDGKLSLPELNKFSEDMRRTMEGDPSKRKRAPAQAEAPAQPPSSAPLFIELDQDRNGTLSKDELKSRPDLQRDFDQIDANHDGAILPEEFGNYFRIQQVKPGK